LVCRALDVDGECFVLKTRDRLGLPSIQLIETHRIGGEDFAAGITDGVRLDAWGAPSAYRLIEDRGPRDVPAFQMLHVFEPEHISAVRAAPTIQHSINHVIDEMELLALEKHAVKDNADVTRVHSRTKPASWRKAPTSSSATEKPPWNPRAAMRQTCSASWAVNWWP